MRGYIEIDGNALENNYLKIKEETNKQVIAVLKSNAYGHGLIECTKILVKNNVPMIAVATKEEALAIRKNLIFCPILLLGPCLDFKFLSAYKITITILSLNHLLELKDSPYPIMIHLFIDVGMHREGILKEDLDEALTIISKSKLILKGVFTHYSGKENFIDQQNLFKETYIKIPHYENLLIHSSSTSTMLDNLEEKYIRIGLALFGLDKVHKPILSLKAKIIRKLKVIKGVKIGYEPSETTKEDGYIYLIGLGYADGLNKDHKYSAYISNYKLTQIGSLCMDYMMFFSEISFEENETLTLIDEKYGILNIAEESMKSPYEIATKLSYRIKRKLIYLKNR